MTRAVQIAELGDQNVFTIDGSNNRVGIGSTQPTEKLDVDGAIRVGTGITIDSVSGVISATKFVGPMEGTVTGNISGTSGGLSGSPDITINNLIGVAATFTGVVTYEDVTNVDSTGIVTAKSGIKVTGGEILVGSGFSVGQAGVATASGIRVGSGITIDSASGIITATAFVGALTGNVTGNISGGTVAGSTGTFTGDVDIVDKIIHTGDTNTAIRFPAADTFTVETAGSERLRITSTGGVHFNNAELIERVNIVGNKLSAAPNVSLDNGMVHYYTTNETTTANPNIISTAGINTNMATGDTMSVTILSKPNGAGYFPRISIDGLLTGITTYWSGGAAPSAAEASGVDVSVYQIIKTGSATYDVLANTSNFA